MTAPRSSLARHQHAEPMDRDEMRRRAEQAWTRKLPNEAERWLCIRLDDLVSWTDRQWAENVGAALYGKRGSR